MAERAEADAVAEIAGRAAEPRSVTLISGTPDEGATVLVAPSTAQIVSAKRFVDEWAVRPARRSGTATLTTLASFIDHANRHKGTTSVVFADQPGTELVAVYDYNEAGGESAPEDNRARFGKHRAIYSCPSSEEWTTWNAQAKRALTQAALAELVETRIADVLDPASAGDGPRAFAAQLGVRFASPAQLMALSRGLAVTVNHRVQGTVNLANGEGQIAWVTEHQSDDGKPLTVPGAFLLALRVFDGGAAYQVPARLRYRVNDGKIAWTYDLYRADRCLADAFAEVCTEARAKTELPLFMGSPEA